MIGDGHTHMNDPAAKPPIDAAQEASEAERPSDGANVGNQKEQGGVVPHRRRRLIGLLAVMLLGLHATLALTSTLDMSETCDEVAHLTAGYSYWKTGDFRLVPEHPPLAQLWAAVPLLISQPKLPSLEEQSWHSSDQWAFGKSFLYDSGNGADGLLLQSRAMIVLLSVATGLVVFIWSSRLFGVGGGLFSLMLYAFSPTMLANASVVTTDMGAGLLFLLSVAGVWRVLQHATAARVFWSGLALGGLLLTKMSGVLIVPMAVGMVLVILWVRRPLHLLIGSRTFEFASRWERLGIAVGLAAVHAIIAYGCIWATFGFRYQAMRNAVTGLDHFETFGNGLPYETSWEHELRNLGGHGPTVQWVRDRKLLPESYLYGFAYAVNMTRSRAAFLNGNQTAHGFRMYFPFTVATKTTLPMLVIAVVAGVLLLMKHPMRHGEQARRSRRGLLYLTTPLWILLIVYWAFAIQSHLNIGHRHMLPTYPPMFILCGCLIAPVGGRKRLFRLVVLLLGTMHAVLALLAWPHYLSYFNELIGGPKNAYRYVVDSSLDWGQDLARLAERLDVWKTASKTTGNDASQPTVYLAYLCNTPPEHYGIRALSLRSKVDQPPPLIPLQAGLYCISATRLQQVYDLPMSRWTPFLEETYQSGLARVQEIQNLTEENGLPAREVNPLPGDHLLMRLRFARLAATLRRREPDDRAGYSILMYRLTQPQIDAALLGPPPELAPDTAEGAYVMALNLVRVGDPDRAAALLEWAVRHDPDNANMRHWLGFARHQQGRRREAVEHYVEALSLDPTTPGAYSNLGLCLAELGRLPEAVDMYREAIRLEPLVPETCLNLAKALVAVGDCGQALKMSERAVKLRPADPVLREGRARVRARCGQEQAFAPASETLVPTSLMATHLPPVRQSACCDD